MTVADLYKVLENRAYVVLYDTNYSRADEVYQGGADNIPIKYMSFIVTKIAAQIIEGDDIAYLINIC